MLCALAFSALAIAVVCPAPAAPRPLPAEDLAAKLNKHVSNYNLGVINVVGALLQVSNDFQIPMGITWVNSRAARAESAFAWKNASIGEIIQSIANTQPGYEVRVRNSVVHVSPSGLIPDAENFLKTKLPSFQTHNTMVEVASFKLHMLVTPIRGSHQVSIAGPGDSKVDVQLKNCTVEDVLDAFVLTSNRNVWIVTFPDKASLTASGLRRTGSLFTDALISDDQQPVWYLHHQGDPPPPLLAKN